MAPDIDELTKSSILQEYRFESRLPVVGVLIARLRATWYAVASQWADAAIIRQQTAYNQLVAQHLSHITIRLATVEQQLAELDQRLIMTDHDLVDLTRTVAESTQQVIALRRTLETVLPNPTESPTES